MPQYQIDKFGLLALERLAALKIVAFMGTNLVANWISGQTHVVRSIVARFAYNRLPGESEDKLECNVVGLGF